MLSRNHVNYFLMIDFVHSGIQMVRGQFLYMLLWFIVQQEKDKPYPKEECQQTGMEPPILKAGLSLGGSKILRLFISN